MESTSFSNQSFTAPGEDLKYNGANHGKVVIYFMGQMQICYPPVYLWLTSNQLPRDSPHNPRCWYDANGIEDVPLEEPESPNCGVIMVSADKVPKTSASSSNVETGSSASDSTNVPKASNRRESGGHALFGNLGGIDLNAGSVDSPPTCAAYFTGDPFGGARCKIRCSDARTVADKELQFGSLMRAASACMLLCLTHSIKNKLMTNLDFRHAAGVGRVDVMLFVMRILDSNHFSSTIHKNMLNTFSFPILLEFLKITQGSDSLAGYTKRFNDKLLGLNTLGALVSTEAQVQLLLNNLWGQLFIYGLNDAYSRGKYNACEKGELDYPKPELEIMQSTARVWEESSIRRKKMFSKPGDVKVNAATLDSDDDMDADEKKHSKSTKKSWTREEKDQQVKIAVAVARKAADQRFDQLKSNHQAKVKSMGNKKNSYCFLCGYNKGHPSHLCGRLPSNLKADALAEFNRQSEWLASNSRK